MDTSLRNPTSHFAGVRAARWKAAVAGAIAVTIAAALFTPSSRSHVLREAGALLVAEDSIEPADIIVLTADSNGAGVLEAADLVHRGVAARVAVFTDPPNEMDREFLRRGAPYEDGAARFARQLKSVGVENIEYIPRAVAGTEDEGRVLPDWCDRLRFRSVIVVSTSDHSRRLGRVLARAMEGHATQVRVRYSRYSEFDPNEWWTSRGGARTWIIESEKLLLDYVRHPLS